MEAGTAAFAAVVVVTAAHPVNADAILAARRRLRRLLTLMRNRLAPPTRTHAALK
jgi:hypothetical protein